MDYKEFKTILNEATKCSIQYNGWPCGTCFFSLNAKLKNKDWQCLLYFRGDTKFEELSNLPKSLKEYNKRLENIKRIALKTITEDKGE